MALHEARVTSKGQITIPRNLRRRLGVKPGDTVIFDDSAEVVTVEPAHKTSRFAKYRGICPDLPRGKEAIIAYVRDLRDP